VGSAWRDPDLPELVRARALLDVGVPVDDDVDALVGLLNEPLPLLPRLAFEALDRRRDVVVAADITWQRLRACRHDHDARVADEDTIVTGRSTCADCGAAVAPLDRVAALASSLEACAFFRGVSVPSAPPWVLVDHRRVDRRSGTIRVGAGPADDVVVAGLPAGGVVLVPGDDVVEVRCAEGLRAVAMPRCVAVTAQSTLQALARPRMVTPLSADVFVFREHEPQRPAVSFFVDVADAWSIDVRWPAFGARSTLRVGDVEILSFDGMVRGLRTVDGVFIHVAGREPNLIALEAGVQTELPFGEATALWSGRTLEVRGCPPPPARAPAVNLLVSHVAARRS
jgi:hypothetical protein